MKECQKLSLNRSKRASEETSLLFSFGIPQKEISLLRSVAYKVVKETMVDARNKFEPSSLTGLLTVFHVRLALFALYGCRVKNE